MMYFSLFHLMDYLAYAAATAELSMSVEELIDWLLPIFSIVAGALAAMALLWLAWKRRVVRQNIRRMMPLPPLSKPPAIERPAPPIAPRGDPIPLPRIPRITRRPALVVGLGDAGRWTLTYLKQTLQTSDATDGIGLLAFNILTNKTSKTAAPIAVAAHGGSIERSTVALEDAELCWLPDDTSRLDADFRRDPASYPRLGSWLGDVTRETPHVEARLAFLANLPTVEARLKVALAALQQLQGLDVYLVAGLGETIGAGALIDLAQLLHLAAHESGQSIAIHAILYPPETNDATSAAAQQIIAASRAAWQAIEQSQAANKRQIAYPLLFDLSLLGRHESSEALDGKLFNTCTLLNLNNQAGSPADVLPQHGIYPMAADAICARLEIPAATFLTEQRIGPAQERRDPAICKGIGTFTYCLHPGAIIQEAADRLLDELVDRLMEASSQIDEQRFFAALSEAADYDLYRKVVSITPEQRWQPHIIRGLLDPPTGHGTLDVYAREGLPRFARYELLRSSDRNTLAMRAICRRYYDRYLGTPTTPGEWAGYVGENAITAVRLYHDMLLCEVGALLNDPAPGALTRALTFCSAVIKRTAALQTSLNAYIQVRKADLPDPKVRAAVDSAAPVFDRYALGMGRQLLGYPTSATQEQSLRQQQSWINTEMELLVARGAGAAAEQMHTIARQIHTELTAFATSLRAEQQAARRRIDAARAYRLAQIDLGHVRYDWGMPHADVTQLRKHINPRQPLPKHIKQEIQALHSYLAGDHITALLSRRLLTLNDLAEQLSWGWMDEAPNRALCAAIRDGSATFTLIDGASFRAAITTRFHWIWGLRLPDLLAPATDLHEQIAPLQNDIRQPLIPHDQHEKRMFLIVPPATDPANARWFEQIVATQQQAHSTPTSHRLVVGVDPYRITALTTYEVTSLPEPPPPPAGGPAANHRRRPAIRAKSTEAPDTAVTPIGPARS